MTEAGKSSRQQRITVSLTLPDAWVLDVFPADSLQIDAANAALRLAAAALPTATQFETVTVVNPGSFEMLVVAW
nr:hypothetical protein [Micromonospora sp. DSM 115978]